MRHETTTKTTSCEWRGVVVMTSLFLLVLSGIRVGIDHRSAHHLGGEATLALAVCVFIAVPALLSALFRR